MSTPTLQQATAPTPQHHPDVQVLIDAANKAASLAQYLRAHASMAIRDEAARRPHPPEFRAAVARGSALLASH